MAIKFFITLAQGASSIKHYGIVIYSAVSKCVSLLPV